MQLLPAVEDGGPALIVQLQVRQSFFSSKGLKDDCGIDPYLSLVNELRKQETVQSNTNKSGQTSPVRHGVC